MLSRIAPYIAMFLVCFVGVYLALTLHDRFGKRPTGLDMFANYKPVSTGRGPGQVAFEDAVKRVQPAVVSVFQFQKDFWTGDEEASGLGSGVIISPDGYIITNFHVIDGADSLVVKLADGTTKDAQVVGADRPSDLALLKVDGKGLPFAEIGDSDSLVQGEWVFAIGAPLGIENTLSVGVVSAVNRDLPGSGGQYPLVGAIQTDAAINEGNSGGPLANVSGQVVGINTAIVSPTGGSVGLGFAIPSKQVLRFVQEVREYGRMRHPSLGIRPFWHDAPNRDVSLVRFLGGVELPDRGLIITDIAPNGPAATAGLKRFDIITKLDGQPLRSFSDFLIFMMKAEVGQKVKVSFWRDGKEQQVEVTLEDSGS